MNQLFFDKLIIIIADAITSKISLSEIHDAIIDRGWSEEEAYLVIQAGELLARYRLEN